MHWFVQYASYTFVIIPAGCTFLFKLPLAHTIQQSLFPRTNTTAEQNFLANSSFLYQDREVQRSPGVFSWRQSSFLLQTS